jgi:multimeric flavodoxin WrbA
MKTVCVLGSPRPKGNSTAIAAYFCDRLESLGAEVQTFTLNKLTYQGCQACMVCKTKLERCVLADDLTQVLDAVHEADLLVLATPVYFGDITSQLKGFVDRMYSFFTPDYRTSAVKSRLAPGKKLVLIQVQGRPDESKFADIFPRYGEFWDWYGINERYQIRSWGVRNPGEIVKDKEVFKKAEDLAARIMRS